MDKIIIKDEKGNESDISLVKPAEGSTIIQIFQDENYVIATDFEARQAADGIYRMLGLSIEDLQRQAFEAGRKEILDTTVYQNEEPEMSAPNYLYDTYTDYTNSLTNKNGDNG